MVGCPPDDTPDDVVLRPYSEVYAEDIAEIEDFMNTHFMTVDGDNNVTFTEITPSTPGTPISDGMDNSTNQDDPAKPLKHKVITKGGVDHKLYFIKLEEGLGNTDVDSDPNNDNPTKLDSIYASYKGYKTDLTSFDEASTPVWFQLEQVVQGWREIFPDFKIGNSNYNSSTGITTFSDFGAGVMFLPSALGYYGQSTGSITAYTPIIFSFKLMKLRYKDHDGDKILSKEEYLGTGLVSGTAIDTDGDGKPDYGDYDDDNDGKLTKDEIKYTYLDGLVTKSAWYPYQGILVDNPATAIDESKGIPSCAGDFSTTTRLRKHLDPSCK